MAPYGNKLHLCTFFLFIQNFFFIFRLYFYSWFLVDLSIHFLTWSGECMFNAMIAYAPVGVVVLLAGACVKIWFEDFYQFYSSVEFKRKETVDCGCL